MLATTSSSPKRAAAPPRTKARRLTICPRRAGARQRLVSSAELGVPPGGARAPDLGAQVGVPPPWHDRRRLRGHTQGRRCHGRREPAPPHRRRDAPPFQTYKALLNAGFASPAHADLLGAAPRYDQRVEVSGLVAKPELNGRTGKVVGVLDRTNGRVSVELDAAKEAGAATKECAEGEEGPLRLAVKPANLLVRTSAEVHDVSDADAGPSVAGTTGGGEKADAAMRRPTRPCTSTRRATASLSTTRRPPRDARAHRPARGGLRILHRTTIKAKIDFDRHIRAPKLNVHGPTRVPASGRAAASGTGGMRPSPCRIDGCSKAAPSELSEADRSDCDWIGIGTRVQRIIA